MCWWRMRLKSRNRDQREPDEPPQEVKDQPGRTNQEGPIRRDQPGRTNQDGPIKQNQENQEPSRKLWPRLSLSRSSIVEHFISSLQLVPSGQSVLPTQHGNIVAAVEPMRGMKTLASSHFLILFFHFLQRPGSHVLRWHPVNTHTHTHSIYLSLLSTWRICSSFSLHWVFHTVSVSSDEKIDENNVEPLDLTSCVYSQCLKHS